MSAPSASRTSGPAISKHESSSVQAPCHPKVPVGTCIFSAHILTLTVNPVMSITTASTNRHSLGARGSGKRYATYGMLEQARSTTPGRTASMSLSSTILVPYLVVPAAPSSAVDTIDGDVERTCRAERATSGSTSNTHTAAFLGSASSSTKSGKRDPNGTARCPEIGGGGHSLRHPCGPTPPMPAPVRVGSGQPEPPSRCYRRSAATGRRRRRRGSGRGASRGGRGGASRAPSRRGGCGCRT